MNFTLLFGWTNRTMERDMVYSSTSTDWILGGGDFGMVALPTNRLSALKISEDDKSMVASKNEVP